MIGRSFAHYRVLEELGKGGMGVVYLAEDTLLGRRVAVKFPSATGSRNRLLAEARAASVLNHPSIAAVYDCGEVDGAPYIVMELVEGKGLNAILREGPLPPERSLDIAIQVAQALEEAHRRHIAHRDIKPSNILIDARGAVKVVDFGLAKSFSQPVQDTAAISAETQTIEGAITGTPQYMSPEQARGESGDERSDLFSLGAVLYECLVGKPPFRGPSLAAVLAQALLADPPAPSQLNPASPAALDAVIRKAMAKERSDRYQSAGELRLALEMVKAGGAPAAARFVLARLFLRSRRARLIALAAFAVLSAAGILLAYSLRSYQPSARALGYYREGVEAIRNGTYFKAINELKQARELDPRYPLTYARLADAYNELDDGAEASREMVKANSAGVRLSRQDKLAVEAIRLTVAGDYPAAVRVCQDLLGHASERDRPALYLDLGRAQEKAQKLKAAMVSYQAAAALAPDNSAAFMRMGVIARRGKDRQAAEAAFTRAESLYRTRNDVEGATAVTYERGVQALEAGRYPEAASLLDQALRRATELNNYYQAITVLLQLSQFDLAQNDKTAADGHVSAALEVARGKGLQSLTARCLLSQGGIALNSHDYERAGALFVQALELAQRYEARQTEARALLNLGSLHVEMADYTHAIAEIQQGLTFYTKGGFVTQQSQAQTLLGRARRDQGDLDGALKEFERLLELAKQSDDRAQFALAHEGMGSCYLLKESYPLAVEHFQERLKASRLQGSSTGQVYGLCQLSEALNNLGRFAEANDALKEARSIASRPGGLASLVSTVILTEARLALSEGRYAEAAARAQRFMEKSDTRAVEDRIDAQRILGQAAIRSGDFRQGVQFCGQAADLARSKDLLASLPGPLVCRAEALAATGRRQEALADAQEAQKSCAATGRKETEAAAWLAQARAVSPADPKAGQELAKRAVQLLDELFRDLSAADSKSVNSRPDVRLWRSQAEYYLKLTPVRTAPVRKPA